MSDRRAWLCPSCAQFSTRPASDVVASHKCELTGSSVVLIEYVDSTQAEQLRNTVNAQR